jgi:hypothetical protein
VAAPWRRWQRGWQLSGSGQRGGRAAAVAAAAAAAAGRRLMQRGGGVSSATVAAWRWRLPVAARRYSRQHRGGKRGGRAAAAAAAAEAAALGQRGVIGGSGQRVGSAIAAGINAAAATTVPHCRRGALTWSCEFAGNRRFEGSEFIMWICFSRE